MKPQDPVIKTTETCQTTLICPLNTFAFYSWDKTKNPFWDKTLDCVGVKTDDHN